MVTLHAASLRRDRLTAVSALSWHLLGPDADILFDVWHVAQILVRMFVMRGRGRV